MVLICRGPMGAGMEEIYQITSALKHLSFGKHVAVLDRRSFLRRLDRRLHRPHRTGSSGGRSHRQGTRRRPHSQSSSTAIDSKGALTWWEKVRVYSARSREVRFWKHRPMRPDLTSDPDLPDDTRLWAALQRVSGGTWGGCVFDVDTILARLASGVA